MLNYFQDIIGLFLGIAYAVMIDTIEIVHHRFIVFAIVFSVFTTVIPRIHNARAAAIYQETNQVNTNPCPAGQFSDLKDTTCKTLVHPEYGFDIPAFNASVGTGTFTLLSCTEEALRSLLSTVPSTGGTVQLPACTLIINNVLELPNNIILQGMGTSKTIITAGPNSIDQLIKLKDRHNIVVRDLTLDASGRYLQTLLIWYADNILLERLRVFHSSRTAIEVRYINKLTVRYTQASDSGTYHGIVIKDCMNETPIPTLARCEAQYNSASHQYGPLWSTDFLIYSNTVHNNVDHGLDIHGISGEVAGNYSHNNMYGSKFMDSQDVHIHHNRFENNTSWGSHINISVNIPNHIPTSVFFYQNTFSGSSSDYPIRIADPASNIRLAYNTYSTNATNKLRITAASANVFICPDGQEATMPVDGNQPYTLSSAECETYKKTLIPSPNLSPTSTTSPTQPVCSLKSVGDANCDNLVNLVDFEIWRKEYQQITQTHDADYNTSGTSDLVDFEIWRKRYNV